jgi:nucleotide-binding universal stress UspA family protein
MTYKTVLVHLDDSSRASDRLDFAIDFARAFGAHLAAIYVMPPPFVPVVDGEASALVMQTLLDRARELKEEKRLHFERRAEVEDIPMEWREDDGDLVDCITMQARHADIAILGQVDPDEGGLSRDLPELVALSAGRPVLVLPYAGAYHMVGQRVLTGWNASREATRAVHDALPILERSKQVTMLTVIQRKGENDPRIVPGADIATHLARHKVNAVAALTVAPDEEVGDVILSRAADDGADLIVMGCYGHSRFRELVLGGASRHLFAHMTVPILASH